ncbi:MAG: UPF0158 family protein [Myxococcota bacterium]
MATRSKLDVDLEDLLLAMSLTDNVYDLEQFIDLNTGQVILVGADAETPDTFDEDPDRYERIPRFQSRDDFDAMVAFTSTVEESDLREKLELALNGRGAFRRFKDTLGPYPDLRQAWFAALHASQTERALAWLRDLGVDAQTPAPAPPRAPAPPSPGAASSQRKPSPRTKIGLLELLVLGGKTELLSGRVSRRVTLPDPSSARRVFRDIARDICEYHGVGWRKRFVQGVDTFEVEGLHLAIDERRVELSMEVSPETWRIFSGS